MIDLGEVIVPFLICYYFYVHQWWVEPVKDILERLGGR